MIENNWITLVKPNKVDYKISENKKFGTVVIEPLEKGFGTTLGNALRRVLLSSLQGTAITSIKINGVLHEFSTIEGVREDVTDIIMNLKNVTFNSKSNHTQKLTLNVKGPKEVLSSDFDENPEVEIVDKDAVIKSVSKTRCVVTAEEHMLNGGLGDSIAQLLSREIPLPLEMVGVNDTFGESGTPRQLMEKYGLTSSDIVNAVKKVIIRK